MPSWKPAVTHLLTILVTLGLAALLFGKAKDSPTAQIRGRARVEAPAAPAVPRSSRRACRKTC